MAFLFETILIIRINFNNPSKNQQFTFVELN